MEWRLKEALEDWKREYDTKEKWQQKAFDLISLQRSEPWRKKPEPVKIGHWFWAFELQKCPVCERYMDETEVVLLRRGYHEMIGKILECEQCGYEYFLWSG